MQGERAPATDLPAPLTSLIGREAEVAALADVLRTQRLTTITGPGGVGKTRVALEVARRVASSFADGVWLVELAPLRDRRRLAQAVATVLGLQEQRDQPYDAIVFDALRLRQAL